MNSMGLVHERMILEDLIVIDQDSHIGAEDVGQQDAQVANVRVTPERQQTSQCSIAVGLEKLVNPGQVRM